jgi:regulator of cell morphogenesis and NO signaling
MSLSSARSKAPRPPQSDETSRERLAERFERRLLAPTPDRKTGARTLRQLLFLLRDQFAPAHEQRVRRARRLAKRVENLHRTEIDCPKGLTAHLAALGRSLLAHRRQEELILWEALVGQERLQTPSRLEMLRAEHEEIDQQLMRLAVLTRDFTPPLDADQAWRKLCRVCRELNRDLRAQMRLEGDVIYPSLDGSDDLISPRPPLGRARGVRRA